MENWGCFEFNTPYVGEAWLVLFPLEELEEINHDYETDKYLPGHIIIGSDGSGELYGVDENGQFFNVPVMIEAEYVTYFGTNIELLPDEINAFWSE